MEKDYEDKIKVNEKYAITDMAIFSISATMILILMLNCLKIYSDSKSELLSYFTEKVDKVGLKLSGKIDKSIIRLQLYEEKIINILKKNQSQDEYLDLKQSIKEILNIINYKKFDFILQNQYIQYITHNHTNDIVLAKIFAKHINKKNCYIIFYNNDIFVCKNIIFNKNFIGTILHKSLKDGLSDIKSDKNISELVVIDSNIYTYSVIEKKLKDPKLQKIIKKFGDYSNNKFASWVDMYTGQNIALNEMKKYSLVIRMQMNEEFVKNKIYTNFVSKFIEISVFGLFFLVLIILIIRKDKIRNEYTEMLKEDAVYANKAKSDFLTYTAHEIRSPLGFIITGTEMIKAGLFGTLSDKCRDYIDGINLNAHSILNFIIEILDEEKILQKKFVLNRDFHDVTEILNDVIKHNKTKFYSKKISINTDFQEQLPLLYCDDRKLYQILNNLITNSCKYSKNNILINVKVYIDKKKLFINIQDNGIGMNDDEIRVALKKYESLNSENNKDSYGLGLSIVRLLVEAHEAKFQLSSKKDIGTSVTIIFDQKFLQHHQ